MAAIPQQRAPRDDAQATILAAVARAQAGDLDAFGLVYQTYAGQVFRFVYYRTGDLPLSEDLAADVFVRALRRIGSWQWQGTDLGAWLITIARNVVADHFKCSRHRLEVLTPQVHDNAQIDVSPEGRPDLTAIGHISDEVLLAAIQRLGPQQQKCIELRFLRGLSVTETAELMGKNEGAVKALQYRAVRALAGMDSVRVLEAVS